MTNQHLKLPERNVREVAYELSYNIARERLAAINGIQAQCAKSGAQYLADRKAVNIVYLNRTYQISLTGGEVTFTDSPEAVPLKDKILVMHYFTSATGAPLTGKVITYKELHDGINYYPTFHKRSIEPVVNRHKDEPQKLLDAGKRMGGVKADYGDGSVTIPAFPRVPLTYVVYKGDSEFPPDGNILFDSTITDYLPIEDITIICETIAWRLARS
jgi:hypothetical protein